MANVIGSAGMGFVMNECKLCLVALAATAQIIYPLSSPPVLLDFSLTCST